jgi:collagen type III alpha
VRDFSAMLQAAFVPMDLAAFPGTRVLNVDPPVLAVDDFLPAELCDRLRSAAEASGRMRRSRVGGADSPSGGGVSDEGIRTSTTLAIGREALAASPELDEALSELLGRAEALFGGGGGDAGATPQQQQQQLRLRRGLFSKPSSPGELVAEMPQVARYLPGQHFLAHEDAFPPQAALQRGFQRRATLLVYLNDVSEGGRTRFEHLGPLDVEPKKGRAAVFFPAFRGGRPDARTLHTATDAAEGHEKWVFQLWLTSAVAGGGSGASGGGQAAAKAGGGGGGVVSPLLPPRGGGGGKSKGGKAGGKAKRR